jgi:hypothetical protein
VAVVSDETHSGREWGVRDRRFHHRADVHLTIDSVLQRASGASHFTTETLDISEGGAKIRVPEALSPGQAIFLQIHLPDGTDHYCRGRVQRSASAPEGTDDTGAWAAVQFIEPNVWLRTAIAGVIETAGGDGE